MRPNAIGWVLVAFFLIGGIAFTVTIPEIFIGQIWIAVSLFLAGLYLWMGRRAGKLEALRRSGKPGTATILEMTQTGVYINEQPQVKLKLRVEGPGIQPYELEKSVVVPLIALGSLSNGRPLTVFVDQTDRENLLIDWFGGGAAAPFTISPQGGAPVNVGEPLDRLTKLMQLRAANLVTEEEFEEHRKRILGGI